MVPADIADRLRPIHGRLTCTRPPAIRYTPYHKISPVYAPCRRFVGVPYLIPYLYPSASIWYVYGRYMTCYIHW